MNSDISSSVGEINYSDLPDNLKEFLYHYTVVSGFDVDSFTPEHKQITLDCMVVEMFSHLSERFNEIATEQAQKELRMFIQSGGKAKILENSKDLAFYFDIALNHVIKDQTTTQQ